MEADWQADTLKNANFSALPTAYYTQETHCTRSFAYFSFQTDTAARVSLHSWRSLKTAN